MTTQESIFYLEAILDDTVDHHDETDVKRIEAVEVAVRSLKREGEAR